MLTPVRWNFSSVSPAALALPVLFVLIIVASALLPDEGDQTTLETGAGEFNLISPAAASVGTRSAAPASALVTPPTLAGSATEQSTSTEATAATSEAAPTTEGTQPNPQPDPEPTSPPATEKPAEMKKEEASDGHNHSHDDPNEVNGYHVHNFLDHVDELLGSHMLADGQLAYGGYQQIGPYDIEARSTITALQPVIEQAITDVMQRDPNVRGEELERKVAKRITELNDWKNLNSHTRENMMILSGIDIEAMDKRERENTVNHLQHSPLPFGAIEEVLSPDTTIDLGYTHTLDKKWTQAADLGDGVFRIIMVSNNNNGSHTGHNLGSFKVQLSPGTSVDEARRIGNEMVENKNKNNKLYLDEAARRILYGQTPWLDFSYLSPEEKRATYAGKRLGQGGPPPGPTTPPVDETTTTTTPDSTSTTVGETTSTTAGETTTTVEGSSTTTPETTSTTVDETTSTTAEEATTTTTEQPTVGEATSSTGG